MNNLPAAGKLVRIAVFCFFASLICALLAAWSVIGVWFGIMSFLFGAGFVVSLVCAAFLHFEQ